MLSFCFTVQDCPLLVSPEITIAATFPVVSAQAVLFSDEFIIYKGKCSKCPFEYVTMHSMPCATMNSGSVKKCPVLFYASFSACFSSKT